MQSSASPSSSLLGSACTVSHPSIGTTSAGKSLGAAQGTLLEVRRLWLPPPSEDTTNNNNNSNSNSTKRLGPLYGFVRMKDGDHRMSGWFPVSSIEVRDGGGEGGHSHIDGPLISNVYAEVTAGMGRTRRAEKLLDYLEERLLRDGRTPTTVRYFVYLNYFIFAPWYYAPYGLLHAAYNPLAAHHEHKGHAASASASIKQLNDDNADGHSPNPYIHDAFLCPFSLRIYTTAEQMRYETATYRRGRLCPPGTEIYRDEVRGYSLFEVNGSTHVTYCRHLFLLGKSFLENKLAGHDVHNYYFYVFCLHHKYFPDYIDDTSAMYMAGYFTWEKQVTDCNLACIVTLPCFAGGGSHNVRDRASAAAATARPAIPKNIGQFMIAASYELAYRRKQVGTPEKPLSDLGAAAYTRFWRRALTRWMYRAAQGLQDSNNKGSRTAGHTILDAEDGSDGSVGVKRPRPTSTSAATKGRGSKRSAAVDVDEEVADADEIYALPTTQDGSSSATAKTTTIKAIAEEVGLEDADVLKTMLGMGLLHRSAEDRSCRLVVPQGYVEWDYGRQMEGQDGEGVAVFHAAKLQTKPKSGRRA